MQVNTIFSTEEINQQARRVLNFPAFKNSPVLSRFLEFIIAETLNSKELHIKEYSIAIHVLDRSRDFDPSRDSIVRIHAGRLRRALTDYYLTQGMYDAIIIEIPKGRYIPEFTASGTLEPMAGKAPALLQKVYKPLVAIFPFQVTAHKVDVDEIQTLLEGQLSEELLRFHDIAVIGYYSMEMKAKIRENVLEAGKSAGADYIITGSLTCIGPRIRVHINLLVTATGEVLLSKTFERIILSPALFEDQDNIFQDLIGFADGCYRFIVREKQMCA